MGNDKKCEYKPEKEKWRAYISGWLNKSKKGSKLFADTKHNVDHRNNGKWMPSVRYIDKVSVLIEKDIRGCKMFVSRITAEFADAGGITNL